MALPTLGGKAKTDEDLDFTDDIENALTLLGQIDRRVTEHVAAQIRLEYGRAELARQKGDIVAVQRYDANAICLLFIALAAKRGKVTVDQIVSLGLEGVVQGELESSEA